MTVSFGLSLLQCLFFLWVDITIRVTFSKDRNGGVFHLKKQNGNRLWIYRISESVSKTETSLNQILRTGFEA